MGGHDGPVARIAAAAAMSLFGINNVNRLYAGTYHSGDRCADRLLSILDTTWKVDERKLDAIPREGGLIITANHPTGGLDGVLLIDLLSRIRPDIKFMGNFILQRIESLSDYFIPVNPFNNHDPRSNVKGIKAAIAHLEAGGALMVFPAGEVAVWRSDLRRIADRPWGRSMMRFVREAGVPVVPLWIEARNSRKFYLFGRMHPLLKMALLPREFTNKRHMKVPVRIGDPIMPADTASVGSLREYGELLRRKVDDMA